MKKKVYFRRKRELVFLVFSGSNCRLYISTGVVVKNKYWEQNYVTKNHPNYPIIAQRLETYMRVALGAIQLLPEFATLEKVKDKFLELIGHEEIQGTIKSSSKTDISFIKDFKAFIEKRRPFFKHLTIKKYITTLNILIDFENYLRINLDISTFDKFLFEKFVFFLIQEKNHFNNTIAKHVAVIKAFIRDIYPSFDTSFMVFREYRPEVIALSEKELNQLIEAPLTGPKELARDLFIFLCTTGMRISDVRRFKLSWVSDDLIEYSAAKTMSKAYVPLMEPTKKILLKYCGKPPEMCEQYFNRIIKKICYDVGLDRIILIRDRQGRNMYERESPLYKVVSSHTGRKTFVSIMLAKGVPIQDVMNMSGHQDYKSMKPYIQIDRELMKKYSSLFGHTY
jgi:integrase